MSFCKKSLKTNRNIMTPNKYYDNAKSKNRDLKFFTTSLGII